jgi:hypothetical protein
MSDCDKENMFGMNGFQPHLNPIGTVNSDSEKVDTYACVPKGDMDVFQRSIEQFLPLGKTFEDLTDKEKEQIKRQYRFDYYKPGVYQGITGLGIML